MSRGCIYIFYDTEDDSGPWRAEISTQDISIFFSNTGTEALTGSLIHIHMPWLSSSTRVIFYDS